MARKIPQINASSSADMAFLLLTFFLLATTMNTDSGIWRQLPPYEEDMEEDINQRNIMRVWVSQEGAISVDQRPVDLIMLKDMVKEFIRNPQNDPTRPELVMTDIEGLGSIPVSRGVVSLTNHTLTRYGTYVAVQNELTRAFNELREDLSQRRFFKPYKDLNEDERKAVNAAVPMKISEAEPVDKTLNR